MTVQSPPVDILPGVPLVSPAIVFNPRKRKRSLSSLSSKITTPPCHHAQPLLPNNGNISHDQTHLGPERPVRHADSPIQHSCDAQSLDNLITGADGGQGEDVFRILHAGVPPEVRQCSNVGKDIYELETCQGQAMYKPSGSHLRPQPPSLETLRPPPPVLPSTILRPLSALPFSNMQGPPIFARTSPRSLQGQQSQSLVGDVIHIDYPESQGSVDPLSQLPLRHAQKHSVEWKRAANLDTEFKGQWPAGIYKPVMRCAMQRANSDHVPALKEPEHSRNFSCAPGSAEATGSSTTSLQLDTFARLQLLPTVADHSDGINRHQGTLATGKDNPPKEATDPDILTKSRKRKWRKATRGPMKWDVSSYRKILQSPSRLEGNGEMECDKHRIAGSITPLLPLQALLVDLYPDLPTSNELPLKVERAWDRAMFRQAIFAAAFESKIERGEVQNSGEIIPHLPMAVCKPPPRVSSPPRAPPDIHRSPLHEGSRTSARLAPSLQVPSTMSTLRSGIKPYIPSESRVPGSRGRCASSPSQIELEDNRGHSSTTVVPTNSGKQTRKKAVFQDSDSTLSDTSLSSPPPRPLLPPTSQPPRHRSGTRKKPRSNQSAHKGRNSLSPVVRRRRADVAAKATSSTRIPTTMADAPSLVRPSEQETRETNRGDLDYRPTPRGSDALASIFDGDLSDLEEEQNLPSGSVPDSTRDRLPEAFSSIRLNMIWRTVAPVKVPQRYRERLAVALKGLKRDACRAANTTSSNTARNAVLARAKKVEQGGISGHVSNSNRKVRTHAGQNIADGEIRRILELLTLIRSPPEKEPT